jgi:hypothetical protein
VLDLLMELVHIRPERSGVAWNLRRVGRLDCVHQPSTEKLKIAPRTGKELSMLLRYLCGVFAVGFDRLRAGAADRSRLMTGNLHPALPTGTLQDGRA